MEQLETPQVLPMTFCNQGQKNTIPTAPTGNEHASLSEGFPPITSVPTEQGGIPPDRLDFNGAMNLNSQFYFAFQNGWLPTFNQAVSDAIGGYALNAILWLFDTEANKVRPLRSLIGNNTYNFNTNKSYIGQYWAEVVTDGQGIPIGGIYLSQSKEKNDNPGALPLFTGETIENFSQLYPVFYGYITNHPELCKTSEEYNTAISTYGECPFYVLEETENTLRLPLLKNYVKCANQTDGIMQGLPHSVALQHFHVFGNNNGNNNGSFVATNDQQTAPYAKGTSDNTKGVRGWNGSGGGGGFSGDSNPDYSGNMITTDAVFTGDSSDDTLDVAHTTLYLWVVAFHAEKPNSSQQVSEIMEAGTEQKEAVKTEGNTQKSILENIGAEYVQQAQNWAVKTDGPVERELYSAKKYAQEAAQSAKNSRGLSIGTVYYSQFSDNKQNPGALPLFTGETIVSADTLYPDFYTLISQNPRLQCTEAEYEAALAEYGECPFYVLISPFDKAFLWDFSSWDFGERSFGSMEGNEYKPVSGSPVFYTNTSDINVSEKTSLYLDKACTQPLYSQYQDGNVLKTVSLSLQKVANNARMFQNYNGSITAVYGTDTAGTTNIVFLPVTQFQEIPVVSTASLRLPLLKNYIKCATAADGITQSKAGLPNITGTTSDSGDGNNNQARVTGAFFVKATSIKSNKDDQWRGLEIGFDASRSSAVYGASDTVTPAHTTLYPWVCAYNAAVPASTAQAAAFQGALSGKVDLPSGKTQADVDYVVDSFSDENGNWYRVYKSGWLEQGGFSHVISGTVTVSLLKPFLNTAFSTLAMIFGTPTIDIGYIRSSEKTTSTIKFNTLAANSNDTFQWAAYGQGE